MQQCVAYFFCQEKLKVDKRTRIIFPTAEIILYLHKNSTDMQTYNKIMLKVWLLLFIIITVYVTFKGFTEGFDRWASNYIFSGILLMIFLFKRFMMKRYEKHMAYLDGKEKSK